MDTKKPSISTEQKTVLLYLLFVLLTSFFTYFYKYNYPPAVFWDEPYHIAAAEKYLNGVYFMEQHPPLGKLFIALGEKITNSNEKDDAFITTDYATGFDKNFSFTGYRLFPTLFAWLTAPVLFFIFLFFTKNPALAALLSFVYIFDNAEIVHNRGAMVDSTLTFFGMLQVLFFLYAQNPKVKKIGLFVLFSFLFGLTFSLAVWTKVVALIFILLYPAAIVRLFPDWQKIVLFLSVSALGFFIAFVGVWQTHFALGTKVVTELSKSGYYEASPEYKKILDDRTNGSILNFPVMVRDSLKFITLYNKGVPRLDLCKPDENGSPSFFWPFGGRAINYRWEKTADGTFRYLYLQSNPVAWGLGLLGVILSGFFLLSRVLLPQKEPLKNGFLILVFFGMYTSYMIAISQLERVMYLYHYFIPLLFSFILFGLSFDALTHIWKWKLTESRKVVIMTVLGLLIFAAFQFYRPLTYYEPISNAAFKWRSILPVWELSCVDCPRVNGLAVPVRLPQ